MGRASGGSNMPHWIRMLFFLNLDDGFDALNEKM